MSQLTLSQLLSELGGGAQVTGFFLVLARVSPLFVLAPLFSSKIIPRAFAGSSPSRWRSASRRSPCTASTSPPTR